MAKEWEILKEITVETTKNRKILVKRIKSDTGLELIAINKDLRGVAFEPELVPKIIEALKQVAS